MGDGRKTWEYFGENDPYFAVFTVDRFRSGNLDAEAKAAFFESGAGHVERLWEDIERNFQPDFRPGRALDLGCGVGRIVVPLASRCGQVTGVDISGTMLAEAARNCAERGVGNAEFLQTDEFMSGGGATFDFVHSFIVLQHIEPAAGYEIIARMLDALAPNGIGALHLTYRAGDIPLRFRVYRDYPFIYRIRNLLLGRSEPLMPMYAYDLNRIFVMLHESECHKCVVRFSHHGAHGAMIVFQKRPDELY